MLEEIIENRTLGEIVDNWKKKLTDQAAHFQEEAEKVYKWERQVLRSQQDIMNLYTDIQAMRDNQDVADMILSSVSVTGKSDRVLSVLLLAQRFPATLSSVYQVEQRHDEVGKVLRSMQKEVESLCAQNQGLGDADAERHDTLGKAQEIEDGLRTMERVGLFLALAVPSHSEKWRAV